MEWTNFSDGNEGRLSAGFSSDKLKLADFDLAEIELKKSIEKVGLKYWLKQSSTLIMHQPGDENKLSPLELRALREVGYGAGARMVYLWQGHKLDEKDIRNEIYKNT